MCVLSVYNQDSVHKSRTQVNPVKVKHNFLSYYSLLWYFRSFFNLRQSTSVALEHSPDAYTDARVRTYALLAVVIVITLCMWKGQEQCATKFVRYVL